MSQFDANEYFNRLSEASRAASPAGNPTEKFNAVIAAKQRAVTALNRRALELEAIKAAQANSVVGQMGIDPTSTLGSLANTAVATKAELDDLTATAAATPLELLGFDEAGKAVRDGLNNDGQVAPRFDTGVEQSGLVRRAGDVAVAGAKSVVGLGDAVIGVGDIFTLGQSGKGWDALGRDSKATHRFLNDLYSPAQRLANQHVDDAKGFLGTVETMLDNPSTIPMGIIESLAPMLAGGKIGQEVLALYPKVAALVGKTAALSTGVAGAIGEGAIMAGSQAEGIRQETADRTLSLKQALLAAGTGVMGAGVARLGGAAAKKLGVGDIDEALVAGALAKTPRGYTRSMGLSSAIEAGEEAAQSAGETILKNIALDKPWDQDVGNAAAQGMLTAAPLGALSGAGERIKQASREQAKQETARQAQEAAIASGDVTALLDPKNASYSPARAIAALLGNSALPTATEESKQANLTKAGEIVASLQAELDGAQKSYDSSTPEGVKAMEAKVAEYRAMLAIPRSAEQVKQIEGLIETELEDIAEAKKLDPAEVKRRKGLVTAAEARLQAASKSLALFNEDLNAGKVDVDAEVATINAPTDEKDAAAVSARSAAAARVINLSMAIPGNLTTQVAQALANNPTNGLTTAQRTYLRAFTKAREVENASKDVAGVSAEILNGSNKNRGIPQHRQFIGSAIASGQQAVADRHMALLRNFEEDHRTKAELSAQALEIHQTTGKVGQVIRTAAKTWELNKGRILPWGKTREAQNNGAVTFHNLTPNAEQTLARYQAEAAAITAALNEMQAAYAVKFAAAPAATSTPQGAPNVPVVPQAQPQAPNPAPGPQEPQAAGSSGAVSGNVPNSAPAGGAAVTGVEASGVASVTEQISIPAVVKAMSDAELNAALEVEMAKPNYQKNRRFKVLDAEMTRREDQAAQRVNAEQASEAAPLAEETEEELKVLNAEPSKEVDTQKSAEQTPAVVDATAGKLSLFNEPITEGAGYTERNLVATGFTQEASREGNITKRPLVVVKDFLTNGWDLVMNFVESATLTDAQVTALDSFWKTAAEWSDTIRANLPERKKRPEFRYEDMMQFLLVDGADGQLDMDENVKVAIAHAAFTWAAEQARSPRYLKKAGINSILGRGKKDFVSHEAWEVLGQVGNRESLLADSLGKRVMGVLGLKAKPTASQEQEAKLVVALGLHVLKLLEDKGLITRTTVPGSVMAELRLDGLSDKQIDRLIQRDGVTNDKLPHTFFAVARNEDGTVVQKVTDIFEANKDTQGILNKLLGTESGDRIPFLTPIKQTQRTTSGTKQGVPSTLAAVTKKKQSRPRVVRKDLLGLLQSGIFEETAVESMIGIVPEENELTHVVNERAVVAQNDGLRREYNLFTEYVKDYLATAEKELDTEFFIPFDVWKQQRVGQATNVANAQTSKIVRFLIGSAEWTTEIDPTNEALMNGFYLRVGEGLGVKTERADNAASIDKVKAMLQDPVYSQAVNALAKAAIQKQELSAEEKASIVAGVAKGGGNLHSLDALMAVAYQQAAVVDGVQKPFTVQMLGEVDGVANGTMFNHVLYGAGDQAMLNKGGFFEVGHPHSQYNQYRGQQGNQDIYETTARKIHQLLQGMFIKGSKSDKNLAAIWNIAGELFSEEAGVTKAGRQLVKDALNPIGFGSSLDNVIDGISGVFLANVYAGFEKLSKNKATQEAVDAYVRDVNQLISREDDRLPIGESIKEYMATPLSSGAEASIRAAVASTVGEATREVVEQDFAVFLERRGQFNNTVQFTFGLYEAVQKGVREAFVQELLDKGEIEQAGGGRLADLNKVQEVELAKRLAGILPILETSMSQNETGEESTGLVMAKTKRRQSTDPAYVNITQFGTPIVGVETKSSKTGWGGKMSTRLAGVVTVPETPGVGMLSAGTHSFDSGVMAAVEAEMDVLGIHDAAGAGVGQLEAVARALNKATWEGLLNYSPMEQAYQAMARTIDGIATMRADGALPIQAVQYLQSYLNESAWKVGEKYGSSTILQTMLTRAKTAAYEADKDKLTLMKNWAFVDQYAYQGGNYGVTESNRAEAAKKLADLPETIPAKTEGVLASLGDLMTQKVAYVKTTPVAEGSGDVVDENDFNDDTQEAEGEVEATAPAKTNPFGEAGTPAKLSAPLVRFFKARPQATAAEVLKQLGSMMNGDNKFKRLLVGMLIKSMPTDIKVIVVTPDTVVPEKDLPELENRGRSYGWKAGNTIYILGDGFVNSGLQTTEVLLHELVHGALQHIIASPRGKEVALIADLKSLMKQAADYAKQNGVTGFEAALSDLDEFVAYGMTHKPLQELLAKVSVVSSTQTTGVVDGFKSFVNKLVGLLFERISKTTTQEAQAQSALAALIENVTGLLESGTEEQSAARAAPPWEVKSMAAPVFKTYSTLDIHAALNAGNVTPEFDTQLRGLLSGISLKLHGTFGALKESLMKDQALTAADVWAKALATGAAPFALSVQASPLQASEQEQHAMEQVEATVRAALESGDASVSSAYRELDRLFTEASTKLKPSDFNSQDEYDFIFDISSGANGRSEHLARFAAFGLANQQVSGLLKFSAGNRQSSTPSSISERLLAVFEQLLDFFHSRMSGTFAGQQADLKLKRLVEHLVDIEAKKRLAIVRKAGADSFMAPVEEGAKKLVEAGLKKVSDAAGSQFIKTNRFVAVRLGGSLVRTVADGQVEQFLNGFNELRAKHFKERMGIAAGTFNYVLGATQYLENLLRARKVQEGERKDIITGRSKMALTAFANDGKDLTDAMSSSITQVFMRTGMYVLSDQFDMAQLEALLGDRKAMATEIAALEAQLTVFGRFKDHYIHQANALAFFKMTGRSKVKKLMMNGHNIARLYGTPYRGRVPEAQAVQAEAIITKLVTMYALQDYTTGSDLARAKAVLRTENARTDGNGVAFVLAMHKRFLEVESKSRLFKNQEALMAHGYTPEIYTPNVDVVTATATDGADLKRRGYVERGAVEIDPAHPDQEPRFLYSLEGGGQARYLSGIMSNTGMTAKGREQHSGYMNIRTADGLANAVLHADIMNGKQEPLASGPRPILSKKGRTFMAPVVNPQGDIVNWRYLMYDSTKDQVLKRDNRFNVILGTLAGSIYDKETAGEVNTRVLEALKATYDAQKATSLDAYVMIGPKSPDADAREIWSMLSDATKDEARRIWGRDGMFVRNDSRDIVFGYRKLSLANAVKETQQRRKEAAERAAQGLAPIVTPELTVQFERIMAKIFTRIVEHALVLHARTNRLSNPEDYAERAEVMVARGEKMWQEIAAETKDILVIKTVTVMMGNLKSNVSLLVLTGVPIADVFRHHIVAWRGATSYQRDSEELARLQTLLDIGQTNGKDVEIKARIARVKDSLSRNPVKSLIEEGLMPTIVEDASADEDIYSYKSALTEKMERLGNKLHPTVKDAAKVVYMAKDTRAYRGLRQITQLSDFMARYTQYQHLTTRKKNPLSHAEAIQQSSEDFINYDIPMQRGMQYLDDMGIMPFMKYFLRIQKVIARVTQENPARVLGAVVLGQFMDLGPIVLDSGFLHKIGNDPTHWGALEFPGALDELATVSTALAVVN